MGKRLCFTVLFWGITHFSLAQDSTTSSKSSMLIYGDVYYSQLFNNRSISSTPLMVNHSENGQVGVNTMIACYSFLTKMMRANAGLVLGSYAQENYAAEPFGYRSLYQANIGLKISAKHNVWVDAGIMPSHIGLEAAIAADNPTIYRSMAAEFSPYYETGVKISAQRGKYFAAVLLLNGWQRIRNVTPNAPPALGLQYSFTGSKVGFNYSGFLGNLNDRSYYDFLFNNIYATVEKENWKIYMGADIGIGKLADSTSTEGLYTVYGICQYGVNENSTLALRMEYYSDPSSLIAKPLSGSSLNCFGTSITYSYNIFEGCLMRAEYRYLQNDSNAFLTSDLSAASSSFADSQHMLNFSISFKMQKVLR